MTKFPKWLEETKHKKEVMMYTVEIAGTFHHFNRKGWAYVWAMEMSSRGWGPFQIYPKEPK